jgi:hypothetical protein
VAERSMAADCKSAGNSLRWFKSIRPHHLVLGGSNSGVESQPSKLLVAGSIPVSRSMKSAFDSKAHVAQLVEHVLGKDGVTSSNLVVGSSGCFGSASRKRAAVLKVGGGERVVRGGRLQAKAASGRVSARRASGAGQVDQRDLTTNHNRLVTSRASAGTGMQRSRNQRGRRKDHGQAEV